MGVCEDQDLEKEAKLGSLLDGSTNNRVGQQLGCLTSSLSSTPLPVAEAFPVPARAIPAVMPPFLGLLGLKIIKLVMYVISGLDRDKCARFNFDFPRRHLAVSEGCF